MGVFIPALMALVFPVKESVGGLLLFLVVGDLIAAFTYGKSAALGELRRLLTWVLIGIVAGALMQIALDDAGLKKVLGALIVCMTLAELVRPRLKMTWQSHKLRAPTGICGGIATVLGNAAGPIMSVYFLSMKFDKTRFMGTAAVFFLIVNVIKIPIFAHLGMIKTEFLIGFLWTFPLVAVGAIVGRQFLKRIPAEAFRNLVLGLSAVAGVLLFVS